MKHLVSAAVQPNMTYLLSLSSRALPGIAGWQVNAIR